MNRRFLVRVLMSMLALGVVAGCAQYRCRRPFAATCPKPCGPCAGAPIGAPPPGTVPAPPAPAGAFAPPAIDGGVPPAPTPGIAPSAAPAPTPPPTGSPLYPNPPPPEDTRRYGPQVDANWQPSPQAGVRLSTPEASATEPRESVRLQAPATPEPPSAVAKPPEPKPSPSLPVGIPQFAVVIPDKVMNGQKPALEGFDWLKANNYRTVLHLLKPGEPDAARRLVEQKGFKYVNLEVSSQDIGKALDEFNRHVAASENHPLFVYDQDGSLAGALWYLHFRTVEPRLPEAEARRKAEDLGLKDSTGEGINLWLAINEYLRKKGK